MTMHIWVRNTVCTYVSRNCLVLIGVVRVVHTVSAFIFTTTNQSIDGLTCTCTTAESHILFITGVFFITITFCDARMVAVCEGYGAVLFRGYSGHFGILCAMLENPFNVLFAGQKLKTENPKFWWKSHYFVILFNFNRYQTITGPH